MDYRKCAQEIYDTVGKRENLVSAAHCATRLRLVTKDNSKVDMKVLEDIDGVKGVFSSNGQLQIIIGTGTVNKVYDEFLDISGMTAATKDDVKAAAAASQPLPKRMVKALGDVFVPILPAIVASGLMMGLVEALGNAIPSFADTGWYSFLDMISGTAFSYLPVLVAISAARVFGGNLFLGAVIGLAMIHSNLINAWSVAGMASSDIPVWNLLNITIGGFTWGNVRAVGYQGHVIPVIIAVYFMCWLEKRLHKIVPEVIDLFVTPLVTVLVTTFLTFTTIGPVFSTLETYVLSFASWLITLPFGLGAMVMGAIYPLTVVCGIHHMYNVIEAGLLSEGSLNIWMPIASAANFAQCGACLAVALKTKKAKNRTIAIPSALSASLGITEPAIFGVNLRYMKPLICGMIGGAIGAAFGTIMNIGANAYGVTGIPGFLIVDSHYILPYAILLLISGGIAFALCYVVFRDEEDEPAKKEPAAPAIKTEPNTVYCPVEGNVIARDDIPDATFASGALGDGVGIEPTTGVVVAPFDGTISTVAETKHAVGISSNDGLEMLIHVGIDTVAMNGKGFEPQVAEGDTVKAGQVLLRFSLDEIRKAGYSTTTAVLVCNADEFDTFQVEKTGPAKQLEKLVVCK
ncbi:MAG: glucose PTS transporter subunit IIA [Clostridiales bacterium]|nr:glucose PTS transporter subunit IIA [Clostridiales bacterium]